MSFIDRLYRLNEKITNTYLTYLYWAVANILIWLWALTTRCVKKDINNRGEKIIVSLTSFPKRIRYVWLTIRSILENSCKPDKVLLWLSKEQFPNGIKSLPRQLRMLTNYGLEIRFVEGDIKSHKKYYYAYQEYPDDLVLLIDDDLIYPSYFIANLYNKWKQTEKPSMVFNYGQQIYNDEGVFMSSEKWYDVFGEKDNCKHIMAGSGGGLLLKPATLDPLILNKKAFCSLTPFSDDYWLDTIIRYSGVNMYKTRGGKLLQLFILNNFRLWTVNRAHGEEFLEKLNLFMKENYGFEPYPAQLSV